VKYLFPSIFLLLAVSVSAGQAATQESHFTDAGARRIFLRSAFAHGYSHGYEEGYHQGNIDVNMAHTARTNHLDLHGIPLQYSPEFGSKKSFESGFRAGLKPGYADGYAGRKFRAVEALRSLAGALDEKAPTCDPQNAYFDGGFASGYGRGLEHAAGKPSSSAMQLDASFEACQRVFHPRTRQDEDAQPAFCDGYRRGYMLGNADALAQGSDSALSAGR
jgi:hypothetical protein